MVDRNDLDAAEALLALRPYLDSGSEEDIEILQFLALSDDVDAPQNSRA